MRHNTKRPLPVSFSPNMVKNIVKLMEPGASAIISSMKSSDTESWPCTSKTSPREALKRRVRTTREKNKKTYAPSWLRIVRKSSLSMKSSRLWSMRLKTLKKSREQESEGKNKRGAFLFFGNVLTSNGGARHKPP
jgi:hypothetical protein